MSQEGNNFVSHRSIRAEIEYRKRLTQQHLGITHYFDDHKDSLDEVFSSWIQPQIQWFDLLFKHVQKVRKKERPISRFLEIGSEKAHLGIHLRNHYGIKGVSTDLSFDTFHEATPIVQEYMGAKEKPYLVSMDVHTLALRDNSFDFIFCFSSLHHFHHPHQALEEIMRVLNQDGGVFMCSWEPMWPVLRKKRPIERSEVQWGGLENSYTYYEYMKLLKRYFRRVERVFMKNMQPIRPPTHRGLKGVIRDLLPSTILWTLQKWVQGSDNFTAICWIG